MSYAENAKTISEDYFKRLELESSHDRQAFWLTEAQRVGHVGYYIFHIPSRRWTGSKILDDIFGIDPSFDRTVEGWSTLLLPEDKEAMLNYLQSVIANHQPFDKVYRINRRADGVARWVHGLGHCEYDRNGNPLYMLGTIQDVTEHQHIEEALHASEQRFRFIAENVSDVIWTFDLETEHFTYVSPSVTRQTGFTPEEILGRTLDELLTPSSCHAVRTLIRERLPLLMAGDTTAMSASMEVEQFSKTGSTIWVEFKTNYVTDAKTSTAYLLGSSRDITQRKLIEEGLRQANRDKEILLKEIHHRVKNNLQIISSLLSLQASHSSDFQTKNACNECQNRIRSMALIHDKLYRSHRLDKIDFAEYVRSLTEALAVTFAKPSIRFETSIENLSLSIDTAISCGLLITELITNCVKHGFPEDREGTIRIELSRQPSNNGHPEKYKLIVADNGIGLSQNSDSSANGGLGMQLVSTFVRQLRATSTVTNENGMHFEMTFSPDLQENNLNG